jgi:hypothetical protein
MQPKTWAGCPITVATDTIRPMASCVMLAVERHAEDGAARRTIQEGKKLPAPAKSERLWTVALRATRRTSSVIASGTIAPMSDTSRTNQLALRYNAPRVLPRQPKPGEEVWRLQRKGRVVTCDLRNDTPAGLGWDVRLFEDGELLFSKRCPDAHGALYTAQCFKQDYLRTGFAEERRP